MEILENAFVYLHVALTGLYFHTNAYGLDICDFRLLNSDEILVQIFLIFRDYYCTCYRDVLVMEAAGTSKTPVNMQKTANSTSERTVIFKKLFVRPSSRWYNYMRVGTKTTGYDPTQGCFEHDG